MKQDNESKLIGYIHIKYLGPDLIDMIRLYFNRNVIKSHLNSNNSMRF